MDECCLCKKTLKSGSARSKRKKLFGNAAKEPRDVLENFCKRELDAGLNEIVEVSGTRDVYLCNICSTQLTKVPKLEKELQSLKQAISFKIKSLHLLAAHSGNIL